MIRNFLLVSIGLAIAAWISLFVCDLANGTYWTAVGSIASIISAIAALLVLSTVAIAAKTLRFEAWMKIQSLFAEAEFTKARGELFQRLDSPGGSWTTEAIAAAYLVSRLKDE